MELRVLRYFVESARQESITKASVRLHVTQPTLSRQIKDLEDELGQKLFIRTNYKIHLTPEGELLYKRAVDILELADRTIQDFAGMTEFAGGDVYVGCAESEGISIIARAAKRLHDQYPAFHLHVHSGNAESVLERIDKGMLDFAVIVQEIDLTKYSSVVLPHKDIWGLIVPKNDKLAEKKEIHLDELENLPLILSRQSYSQEMPEWFKVNTDKLNVVATYNLAYNAGILVREGLGYALTLDHLVNTSCQSDLAFLPVTPEIASPMHLVYDRNHTFTKASRLFLDELKKIIEEEKIRL